MTGNRQADKTGRYRFTCREISKSRSVTVQVTECDSEDTIAETAKALFVNKPGLHSNDSATASYKHNNEETPTVVPYHHPVIQVSSRIRIVKTGKAGNALEGAEFTLYNSNYATATTETAKQAAKIKDLTSAIPAGEQEAVLLDERIESGTYYLVETDAPDRYNLLTKPLKIEVSTVTDKDQRPEIKVWVGETLASNGSPASSTARLTYNTDSGIWKLVVVNDEGVELPHTGGPGTGRIYLYGAALILLAVILLGRRKKFRT